MAIAAAVLDLFWRLPKTAVKFLESQPLPGGTAPPPAAPPASGVPPGSQPGLVVLVIELEERLCRMPAASGPLPRVLTSEYRPPLLRFLNKCGMRDAAACLHSLLIL